MKRFLIIGVLVSILPAQPSERLRLIHADLLENITDHNGNAVQYLTGNVKFEKGASTITSDNAIYLNGEEIGSFTGNVQMQEEDQVLTSDSLKIDSKNNIATAHGSVNFKDSEYSLKTKLLIFYTEADSGIAKGDVEFIQKGQTINAGQIVYKKEPNNAASYRAEKNVTIIEEDRIATCGISIYNAISYQS